MKSCKHRIGTALLIALILGTGVVWLPSAGNAGGESQTDMSTQEWVVTEEAQIRTANGDCAPGEICKELCESFYSQTVPLGTFACFAQ